MRVYKFNKRNNHSKTYGLGFAFNKAAMVRLLPGSKLITTIYSIELVLAQFVMVITWNSLKEKDRDWDE